jgi:conjugative transfer region protein TrbK
MMPHLTPPQFMRIAAVGFVVLIVAVLTIVESRHSEDALVLEPLAHGEADALVREIARCRTITSDETAALETCRRVWAENRRQFFGVARLPQSPTEPVVNAPAAPLKNQDRLSPPKVEQQQGGAR